MILNNSADNDSESEDELVRDDSRFLSERQGESTFVIKQNEHIWSIHSSFLVNEEDWRDLTLIWTHH
jgi:hypothetical protein